MRVVTRYQANDGTDFASQQACEEYDRLCTEILQISDLVPPVGEIHDGEWVQLNPSNVLAMQRGLVEVFERLKPNLKGPHTEWARNAAVPAGNTLVGRYIDDCGPAPLRHAWGRLCCIDRRFRQWSQPYYAIQASKE
jgi:hypothetical protein